MTSFTVYMFSGVAVKVNLTLEEEMSFNTTFFSSKIWLFEDKFIGRGEQMQDIPGEVGDITMEIA